MLPGGFWKFLAHSLTGLELLLMRSQPSWAETAHSVSLQDRKATVDRAAQRAIRVTSPSARRHSKEKE